MQTVSPILFHKTSFAMGAPTFEDLPSDAQIEIAIAGRSNAGKSTLINNLTRQNKLARVSQTPGKTREMNLFHLYLKDRNEAIARLVDLPGYGYAKVSKSMKSSWQAELGHYLLERENLKILIVILDSRMPITELDAMLIDMASKRGLQQIFIFNKIDKLNQSEKAKCHAMAQKLVYETPNSSYIVYSSPKNIGRELLTEKISASLHHHAQKSEQDT
ncbi:ribosome biogenesis GTP-binding protein YihA/YsxC [Entomospira culicis]|uniref:Probable GTP-binding protein EngB n=1 Tax=Entomospira culicis TaxID=2719989 RepID=A0A968KVI1_9SPIO|nr:ribosome biogenesis GTP-binding protein YihA/YsxC [Entomospira culicis]NIZ18928.1 YihA family ribosome biogenesis GTP-binding protein [Entomospira culicis]NIZ69143.1 YihA family ribosome biogenesis GTP-binding protein [Entomospira culicis]WDI37729.1 ribosome biogenesis GTP-binding protein YihA/YsxC [Entomospira culicis]WDI39357.1 ribosome biogenesis GTP-binding protein YihA/YsxC [Entomospira culicis]